MGREYDGGLLLNVQSRIGNLRETRMYQKEYEEEEKEVSQAERLKIWVIFI